MMKYSFVVLVFFWLTGCNNEKKIDPDYNKLDRIDPKEEKVVLWDTVPIKSIVVDVDNSAGEKVDIRMH